MKTPLENTEVAQTDAATLVVDHLSKVLRAPILPKSAILQAVTPFYGVAWNRKVLTSISTNRANYELGRLTRSVCPESEYVHLRDFLLQAYLAHGLFPSGTEEWQRLADRYRLDSSHEWEEIAAVTPFLQSRGILTPLQLPAIPAEWIEALCQGGPAPRNVRSFWSISRATFCQPASPRFPLPGRKAFSGSHLIRAIKRHSIQAAKDRKLTAHLSPRLQKLKSFSKMGPSRKIKKLSEAKLMPSTMGRFVLSSTHSNMLRKARGSLPAIASALR